MWVNTLAVNMYVYSSFLLSYNFSFDPGFVSFLLLFKIIKEYFHGEKMNG